MPNETGLLRDALIKTVAVLSEALDKTGGNPIGPCVEGPFVGKAIDRETFTGRSENLKAMEPAPVVTVRSVFDRLNLLGDIAGSLEEQMHGTHATATRVAVTARGTRASSQIPGQADAAGNVKSRQPEGYLELIDQMLQDVITRLGACQVANTQTQVVLELLEEATGPNR